MNLEIDPFCWGILTIKACRLPTSCGWSRLISTQVDSSTQVSSKPRRQGQLLTGHFRAFIHSPSLGPTFVYSTAHLSVHPPPSSCSSPSPFPYPLSSASRRSPTERKHNGSISSWEVGRGGHVKQSLNRLQRHDSSN